MNHKGRGNRIVQGEPRTMLWIWTSLDQLNRVFWNKVERSPALGRHTQTLVLPVCTVLAGATQEERGLGLNMKHILKVLQLEAVSQLPSQSWAVSSVEGSVQHTSPAATQSKAISKSRIQCWLLPMNCGWRVRCLLSQPPWQLEWNET